MDILDGIGIYGSVMNYSFIIALTCCSALIFIYLWGKGRLDMDEEPKIRMMEEECDHERH